MNTKDFKPLVQLMVSDTPSGECPHCGHYDEDMGGHVETLSYVATETGMCERCKTTWLNLYAFVGRESVTRGDKGRSVEELQATYEATGHPQLTFNHWQTVVLKGGEYRSYWDWLWGQLNPTHTLNPTPALRYASLPSHKYKRGDRVLFVAGKEVEVQVLSCHPKEEGKALLYNVTEKPDVESEIFCTSEQFLKPLAAHKGRIGKPPVKVDFINDGCGGKSQRVYPDTLVPFHHLELGEERMFVRLLAREKEECPADMTNVMVIGKLCTTGFDTVNCYEQKGALYLVKPTDTGPGWRGGFVAFQAWENELTPV